MRPALSLATDQQTVGRRACSSTEVLLHPYCCEGAPRRETMRMVHPSPLPRRGCRGNKKLVKNMGNRQ